MIIIIIIIISPSTTLKFLNICVKVTFHYVQLYVSLKVSKLCNFSNETSLNSTVSQKLMGLRKYINTVKHNSVLPAGVETCFDRFVCTRHEIICLLRSKL